MNRKTKRKALIIVDVQRDFCPGGRLAIKNADSIIKPINKLIEYYEMKNYPVYYSRDWHPKNHNSFISQGGIWPIHCVKYTIGAKFHQKLKISKNGIIISKAKHKTEEAYSAFDKTELDKLLKKQKITNLTIVGLATDYCVKMTVLDALKMDYSVDIYKKAIKAVNLNRNDGKRAEKEMISKGAKIKRLG